MSLILSVFFSSVCNVHYSADCYWLIARCCHRCIRLSGSCSFVSRTQPFEASDLLLGLNFSKVLSSLVTLNKVTAGQLKCAVHVCESVIMDVGVVMRLTYISPLLRRYRCGQRFGVCPTLFSPPHQVVRVAVLSGFTGPILQAAAEPVSQPGKVNTCFCPVLTQIRWICVKGICYLSLQL